MCDVKESNSTISKIISGCNSVDISDISTIWSGNSTTDWLCIQRKLLYWRYMCTAILISATDKIFHHSMCPSTAEGINKNAHIMK